MQKNQKIIFLDIDGVLNTWPSFKLDLPESYDLESIFGYKPKHEIQKDALIKDLGSIHTKYVNILNDIVNATEAKIVVSSSWRLAYNSKIIKNILKIKGFEGEVVGETPIISQPDRAIEISLWLNKNPTNQFIILDDIDFSGFAKFGEKFININYQTGLTHKDAEKAIQLLSSNPE